MKAATNFTNCHESYPLVGEIRVIRGREILINTQEEGYRHRGVSKSQCGTQGIPVWDLKIAVRDSKIAVRRRADADVLTLILTFSSRRGII